MKNKLSEGKSGIPLIGEEDLASFKIACKELGMSSRVVIARKKAEVTYWWGAGGRGLADMTHRIPRPERVTVAKVNDGESIGIDITYEGGGQSTTTRLSVAKGKDGWYLRSSAITS